MPWKMELNGTNAISYLTGLQLRRETFQAPRAQGEVFRLRRVTQSTKPKYIYLATKDKAQHVKVG